MDRPGVSASCTVVGNTHETTVRRDVGAGLNLNGVGAVSDTAFVYEYSTNDASCPVGKRVHRTAEYEYSVPDGKM
jgi:hypothetical protein